MSRGVLLGFVDPRRLRERWRCWWFTDEPFGIGLIGGVEDGCSLRLDGGGSAVMDVGGGVIADTGMTMFVVVPVEEASDEAVDVFERSEPFRELGPVLQRLELGF